MLNLPSTALIKDLKKSNAAYCGEKYDLYEKAYSGGIDFNKCLDKILVRREADNKCGNMWEARKNRTDYINRAGGLIDYLRAAVFKNEPSLIPENEDEYWVNLNWDADGLGTPLAMVLRDCLLSMTLYSRTYLIADFKDDAPDPYMKSLCARMVDDWGHNGDGKLEWVRIHSMSMVRDVNAPIIQQPNIEKHRWTYIDSEEIAIYEALSKPDQTIDSVPNATIVSRDPHEFGCLPVFEINSRPGQWVMDKIYPVIKAILNRESALTWQLDRQAFAQLVLTLDSVSRANSLMTGETSALILQQGESASYVQPDGTTFGEQFSDVDRLVKALYEVVQALALNASATQTQNARQSAEAKKLDNDPLKTLLASFAQPILSALRQWIEAVKEFRREDTNIIINGLDEFTASMEDITDVGRERDGRSREGYEEENGEEQRFDGRDQRTEV